MRPSPPRIEIVIPYYGDPGYLLAAVDSVRAQTCPQWTLLVVDDGYPDPTVRQALQDDPDPRIRYVRNERNLGVAGNFERCRQLASADVVTFLGSDDTLLPGYADRVLSDLEAFPGAAMVQPGVEVVDESGLPVRPLADRVKRALSPSVRRPTELSGERLAVGLLHGDWLYWPALAFRTEHLKRFAFRADLQVGLDLAIVLDMIVAGESLVVDPAPVFRYRRHAHSASSRAIPGGSRFVEDRRFFAQTAAAMQAHGWPRASRAARWRATSRLHALSLVPAALRAADTATLRDLVVHAVSP